MPSDLSNADLLACREILSAGSKSFAAASRLLPARLRDPFAAYYAFCRVSDDLVDQSDRPHEALLALRDRASRAAEGSPDDYPADRGLAWVIENHRVPKGLIDALLEGYAWDVEGRRYATLEELRAYCARVAGSVGVVLTLLMGRRAEPILARAADLGVAMQLTNIARDVGEDARAERVYLPLEALGAEGIAPERLLRGDSQQCPDVADAVGVVVCGLLDHADRLYLRARAGIGALPSDCRPAIMAASDIYGAIGSDIRRARYDSLGRRAHTSGRRKAYLLTRAFAAAWFVGFGRPGLSLDAHPLPETEFLVDMARA